MPLILKGVFILKAHGIAICLEAGHCVIIQRYLYYSFVNQLPLSPISP